MKIEIAKVMQSSINRDLGRGLIGISYFQAEVGLYEVQHCRHPLHKISIEKSSEMTGFSALFPLIAVDITLTRNTFTNTLHQFGARKHVGVSQSI